MTMRVGQDRNVFKEVAKFYDIFVTKELKFFNFKSQVLSTLAFLDPVGSEYANFRV